MNVVAMIVGITSVLILCKVALPRSMSVPFYGRVQARRLDFGWSCLMVAEDRLALVRLCRCLVTVAISILFRTPESQVATAGAHVRSTSTLEQAGLRVSLSQPRHFLGGDSFPDLATNITRRLSHRAKLR